jgi:hypothetical protein
MSFDLSRLLVPLTKGAELETLDERLMAIDEHAAKGRFDEAAAICEQLIDEGIYDVRPLPYLWHAAFLEGGLSSLELSLRVIENLLGASRPALSPSKRQDSLIDKRLVWFFDTVDRAIEYHREHRSEIWGRIGSSFDEAILQQALEACDRVTGRLSCETMVEATRALGQLAARLRDLRVTPAPAASVATAEPAVAPGGSAPAEPERAVQDRSELCSMQLRVAQPFVDLCRQLEAAQVLLEKGDFLRAAVMVEAIGRSLGNFDPRSCFPALFAPFAALVAQHAGSLEKAGGAQGSSVWQALVQYAQVDLRGFVESSS